MPPQPILLYRRRWPLFFQVPFVVFMAANFAAALVFAYVADNRLVTALCLFAAFGLFCAAWTLGRSALETYQRHGPAVVIDASGITDLRDESSLTVPWDAMERVLLDNSESVILVTLRPGHKDSALRVISKALQRWQQRGDVVFSLGGLAYDTRQIQNALKTFHRAAVPQAPAPR